MTIPQREIDSAEAGRRPIIVRRVIFVGAAAVAAFALFSAARPGDAGTLVPSGTVRSVDLVADGFDDNGVNDNGQTPGDVFTQNAQDQSTA
jgi:hypothetical protein